MLHYYDGQLKKYLTQLIRMLSNFSYKDGRNQIRQIPVMYGDMTRQVANIIRDNSENKIPSAPRIAVYITGLEADRERTRDYSLVDKVHIRERAFDANNQEYLNTQGKNYTVERLMPVPYKLSINADLWTTNTDQKLQIIEQILMLFNPSVEIQTTDNFVDWTSLTVVNLDSTTFTNRSIPVGVDSEIDVATMSFSTPIWISPPAKVKRLGIITNIINSIFDERNDNINLGLSMPQLLANSDTAFPGSVDLSDDRVVQTSETETVVNTNHLNYQLIIQNNTAILAKNGLPNGANWRNVIDPHPGVYRSDLSKIFIRRKLDEYTEISGTFSIDNDETKINISWDADTLPNDTEIDGPARNINSLTTIDYIIDPLQTNVSALKTPGMRVLLLGDIGNTDNTDGADAWKNSDNSDFVASENDIVEWSGTNWVIVFDASSHTQDNTFTYVTNLRTGLQYYWNLQTWLLSIDGLYPVGTWRLDLEG